MDTERDDRDQGAPRLEHVRTLSGLAIELISSTNDVDELFETVLRTARDVVGAHQAIINLRPDSDWTDHRRTVSLSDRYEHWRRWEASATGDGIYAWACEQNRAFRMTQAELEAHPRWRAFGEYASEHPPMRGWLVAPLTAPDGHNIGLIQLTDPFEDEFTDDDVELLRFMAAIGSAAIEHQRLLTDITAARAQIEAIDDALPGGVVVRDAHGQVTFANRWAVEHLDVEHREILGSRPGEGYQLLDRTGEPLPADRYPSIRAAQGEEFDAMIVGFVDRTGARRWLATSGRPVPDPDDGPPGGLIVFLDTTAAIESEERLARSERLLREAERVAGMGSWYRDLTSDGTAISDELARMFGAEPGTIVDRDTLYSFIHPDDRHRLLRGAYATSRDGTPFTAVLRIVGTPGTPEVVEVNAERVVDADGVATGLLGTVRDLTEQHRQEERLAAATRMELVGQLAGGLAHDFNNLLTVLGGHAELLRSMASTTQLEHLDVIASATDRAARLTRQLLELGRRELLAPRLVDINAMTDEMVSMARSALPRTVELVFRPCDESLVAEVDPQKLDQVLLNLVLNARDALASTGGEITISTSEGSDPTGARIVRIDVADDGPGMEHDVLERIFEPFFTTKPIGQGTGLGLPSSHGLVVQSGGELFLTSEPGVGTVATVLLPRIDAVPTDSNPERSVATAEPRRGTVFLAEDDDHLRALLVRVLTDHGYTVFAAADGIEAVELIAEVTVPIDVLLTDISMPGQSGHVLANRLRPVLPGVRVIYMSGYTADDDVRAAIASGEVTFVPKPFRVADLLEVVDRAIGSTD